VPLSRETRQAMVAYAQQEMDAAGQSPDASATLFQDCTVAVVQVGCRPAESLKRCF